MAARQVAADATIEQLRTTFNTLSATDFGDISQLSSSISASNLVAAMNELEAEVAGFSASTITSQTNLGAAPATADEFVIVDADAGQLKALTVGNLFSSPTITSPTLIFEGSTADSFETTIAVTDPTADRTITLPNATGTVALQNASIDMNGTELILDADADTSITADTDDQIDIKIAGADDFTFTANKLDVLSGSTLEVNGTLDINGTELILDADADTSITADTDDTIHFKIGGNDRITFTTGIIDLKNDGSQSQLRLYCESSNAHYVALQAPAHADFSGNHTITLPNATATLATTTLAETLTNKTLTTPTINGGTIAELSSLTFEGSTANSFETAFAVVDPTADRTITFPNETFKVNSYANKATLAGDGSTTTITVGTGYNVNQFFVTINGVDQEPTEDFTYSGSTITLDAAPISGDRVVVRY